MTFATSPSCAFLLLLLPWLLPSGGLCESCKAYLFINGHFFLDSTCKEFCCGDCKNQYCCSNPSEEFNAVKQFLCYWKPPESTYLQVLEEPMLIKSDMDDWPSPGPSWIYIGVGISLFVLFMVTIVICFTCSCCRLYKACRGPPRPAVTTATATTFVHVPYPRQPGVAAADLEAGYQGYNPLPVQPQPGAPVAPYPTQYPPPYVAQPSGPPPYHETMTAGAGAPATQPPFNPAYMDPTTRLY